MRVAVGNRVLFDGYRTEQITSVDDELNYVRSSRYEWLIYPWTEWKRGRAWDNMPYGTNTGYGAAFAAFIPLGVLWFARDFLRRKLGTTQVVFFASFCLLAAVWWFALRREPRFGLPLWVAACALSAPLLSLFFEAGSLAFRILFICTLASTCLLNASRPALSILSRVRTHQFSRASVYEYPAVIDQLPPDSRILNYSQSFMNNFALSGTALRTRVVPFYALPAPTGGKLEVDPSFRSISLTSDVLRNYRANYVIEQLDDQKTSPAAPTPGLALESDTILTVGDEKKQSRWRIWRVVPTPDGSSSQ